MRKKILIILSLCLVVLGGLAEPVGAVGWGEVCNDNDIDASVKSAAGCDQTSSTVETTMQNSIQPIINTVLGVVGVIAVVVIVVAGINMASANGSPDKIAKARNTIVFAIVGLVISLLAFAIVNFVLANVFESGVTNSSSGGV